MPRKTKEMPVVEPMPEAPMSEEPGPAEEPSKKKKKKKPTEGPAPTEEAPTEKPPKKKKARKADEVAPEEPAPEAAPKKKKARKETEEAAPKKKKPRKETEEAAPKKKKPRAKSAYQLYQQHKAANKEGNVAFADFSKECSAEWKTMTDEDKKKWVDEAEALKAAARGPPKAKRPPTAFFKFLADFRAKLVGEVPPKEVASKAGEAWRALAPEAKEAWRVA